MLDTSQIDRNMPGIGWTNYFLSLAIFARDHPQARVVFIKIKQKRKEKSVMPYIGQFIYQALFVLVKVQSLRPRIRSIRTPLSSTAFV